MKFLFQHQLLGKKSKTRNKIMEDVSLAEIQPVAAGLSEKLGKIKALSTEELKIVYSLLQEMTGKVEKVLSDRDSHFAKLLEQQ